MAVLYVGQEGTELRMAATLDMSANTSLGLLITRPDGTFISTTAVLGATPETFDVIGAVAANTWAEYTWGTGDLTIPGSYTARLTYNDTVAGDVIPSAIATFEVLA